MRRVIGLASALVVLALATAAFAPPRSPLGPGGVIEMHARLFRALDAGDDKAAASVVHDGEGASLFLSDAAGNPDQTSGAEASAQRLARWARESEHPGTWETRITASQANCSSELSYAVLEFERRRKDGSSDEVRKFRSTSLVRYEDGAWKLFHLHVSPAEPIAASTLARK